MLIPERKNEIDKETGKSMVTAYESEGS